MPWEAFVNDLRFAEQGELAVRISTYSGKSLGLVGVAEVNADEGWVSLKTPATMGDDHTRTRLDLNELASVEVTDIRF